MDPGSPDPRRKRLELIETYDVAIAELRSLNDPEVEELIERLERHRGLIDSGPERSMKKGEPAFR